MRYLPIMCLFRNVGIYRIYPKLLQFLIGKTIGFQVDNFVPTNWMVDNLDGWLLHFAIWLKKSPTSLLPKNHANIYILYVCIKYIYILYMWALSGLNLLTHTQTFVHLDSWIISCGRGYAGSNVDRYLSKPSPIGFWQSIHRLPRVDLKHSHVSFFEARMCCTDLHGGGAVR